MPKFNESEMAEMKSRFLAVCRTVNRPGMEDLLDWLENSDFFTAPASTKFHGNYECGLLEHSLHVLDKTWDLVSKYPNLGISKDSVIIAALFHDITKANYYVKDYKNVKVYSENGLKRDERGRFDWVSQSCYKIDDKLPLGHGEKSVIILQSFIKLQRDEIYAIRWHMGEFDSAVKGGDFAMSKAYEVCPLAVMLHMADVESSYLLETIEK